MSQTERLMAIIDRLCQRNGRLNVAWIRDNFEVSDRQARRDIEYVRERIIDANFGSSVELIYDRAKNEYKLTGSQAELENMFAKSVIASAVAASSVDPLKEILGDKSKEPINNKVRFISQAAELPDYSIFTEILHAIEENIRVKIEYKNIVKEDTVRVIEPLELINYSAIWYIRAYDFIKGKLLTFSLSRVMNVTPLNEKRTFKDFDKLKEEDLSGYGIYSGRDVEIYTMRFYGMVAWIVSNQVWHRNQIGKWINDEVYELSVPASYYRELLAKTLSFGANAEPIAPPRFVEKYYEEVDMLIKKVSERRKTTEDCSPVVKEN